MNLLRLGVVVLVSVAVCACSSGSGSDNGPGAPEVFGDNAASTIPRETPQPTPARPEIFLLSEERTDTGSGYVNVALHLAIRNPGPSTLERFALPTEATLHVTEQREYQGGLGYGGYQIFPDLPESSASAEGSPGLMGPLPLLAGAELCAIWWHPAAGQMDLEATFKQVPQAAHPDQLVIDGYPTIPLTDTKTTCTGGIVSSGLGQIPASFALTGPGDTTSTATITEVDALTQDNYLLFDPPWARMRMRLVNAATLDPISVDDFYVWGFSNGVAYTATTYNGANYLCGGSATGAGAGPGQTSDRSYCFPLQPQDIDYYVVAVPSQHNLIVALKGK